MVLEVIVLVVTLGELHFRQVSRDFGGNPLHLLRECGALSLETR